MRFISEKWQPNLCTACLYSVRYDLKDNPYKRSRDTGEEVLFFFQVKCPSLLTDSKKTYTICSACAESDLWGSSCIRRMEAEIQTKRYFAPE